jgi:16S rRNA (guanine(527)-N(7))-methyltransferase RsmG
LFHVKLDPASILEGIDPVLRGKLAMYVELLRDRAVPMGLVAEGDRDRLEERHLVDSLRALRCLGSGDGVVADLGSGAGLPGVPLAVLRSDRPFALVDRRRKAAGFLDLVTEELGLTNVRVLEQQVEAVRLQADVCLARALAPSEKAWELARTLLRPGGHLVYWAGRRWKSAAGMSDRRVHVEICVRQWFSWQGPLVIMKRPEHIPTKEREDEG